MDYIIIFFVFIIFLVLLIFGLPKAELSFNDQVQDLESKQIRENFKTSSYQDSSEGASTFFDWKAYSSQPHPTSEDSKHHQKPKPKPKKRNCLDDDSNYVQNDYNIYPLVKETVVKKPLDCSKCDALKCNNIDKYVLKSSVPPCPDLSQFALKSMIWAV